MRHAGCAETVDAASRAQVSPRGAAKPDIETSGAEIRVFSHLFLYGEFGEFLFIGDFICLGGVVNNHLIMLGSCGVFMIFGVVGDSGREEVSSSGRISSVRG